MGVIARTAATAVMSCVGVNLKTLARDVRRINTNFTQGISQVQDTSGST